MKKTILSILSLLLLVVCAKAQNADVLKSDAISAESQEQYADAARLFEEAHAAYQAQDMLDTACVYRAGMNYAKLDQYDKAKPLLEEALALNYNYGRTARLLADTYYGLKDPVKAEKILLAGKEKLPEEAIEFDKKLAYLYFNTAQYAKAVESFKTVNEAVPGKKNYQYLYGFSLERTQKYDEAIAVFQAMQEQFPGDKRSKKMLGVTMFEKTDAANEAEVARYEAAKKANKANLESYVGTRERLEQINKGYESARVILEESLQEYPKDQLLIGSLYKLYKKQFKEDKAEQMKKRMN
ncbi:tetratricopeptide repeat protein [Mangrovibacterium marinum]|uniref:Tetratricopeptide repeat protein n=1 Tax=Mangrovibacterium marinum TaxID=1639118 RepID=A0A2T5BYR9_9BACT|nr:tetratricopeptide repeat protein [Mangrovibacterium marinum]PTN07360.1 tetratricopeptide repeat protein [Mangrovibacterium marinum]